MAGGAADWVERRTLRHLCFPPQFYPNGYGPGSRWRCRASVYGRESGPFPCGKMWEALGIQVAQYPIAQARNDVYLKPERWTLVGNPNEVETDPAESGLYDFRGGAQVVIEALRRLYPGLLEEL